MGALRRLEGSARCLCPAPAAASTLDYAQRLELPIPYTAHDVGAVAEALRTTGAALLQGVHAPEACAQLAALLLSHEPQGIYSTGNIPNVPSNYPCFGSIYTTIRSPE